MKKIGLIVAVEIDSILNKYGKITKQKIDGFDVYKIKIEQNTMFVVHSTVGEIAAAGATQFCISKLGCDLIVNFGIVGGLTEEMKRSKLCVAEKIVHYDFDTTQLDKEFVVGQYAGYKDAYIYSTKSLVEKALSFEPNLKKVTVASGDKFVGKQEDKKKLHDDFGADICEMESAGIALTCNRNNVPFLILKCVSDALSEGAKEYIDEFEKASKTCLDLTDKIIRTF